MKKIRWLYVDCPLPISDVSKKLLSQQYNEEKGQGFLLSVSGSNKISGKYIEKDTHKVIVIDPFGNETESITTSYYVSQFNIERSSKLLELTNPPRSLRKFISALHNLLGLGLGLSDINVDPLVWLENIENSLSPVIVTHISSSGIRVPKDGLAKISVSGKKDIRQEFNKLIGGKARNIESLKFSGIFNDCHILAELTKAGVARISGHIYDSFIDEVKGCLENLIQSNC